VRLRHLIFTLAAAAAFLVPVPTHAQGCTQCLDNTAATPPATQRAYRHAITIMVVAAGSVFLTTLVLFKRQP
jgi:hypothetical protein